MKISLKWVKKYVDLPSDLCDDQIAYDLTMRTVEVENIIHTEDKFDNIVVGKVQEVRKHPNADVLRVCMVDLGEDGIKQIVCGGSNLYEGESVVVCKPGAVVVWHGEGEPVKIKESKLRGEYSYGMICASSEIYLGSLFPEEDDAIILDLGTLDEIDAEDIPAGINIAKALGISDTVLEIDNKSLTNRPDLWCHYGIARELSAIYKCRLLSPEDITGSIHNESRSATKDFKEFTKNLPKYDVTIDDNIKCPRYAALQIDNLCVRKSPLYMQIALINAGLRPINAIVDITNYVMLAVGQPMHAFDKSHVSGDHIIIRNACEGEKLELLDGEDICLTTDDLVICDEEEPMALAGIRGGNKDSVLPSTTEVVLEVANFDARTIRKTEKRFEEKTDSGIRYEKGIDTQRVDLGLSAAVKLFFEIFPECKLIAFEDLYPRATERTVIDVTQNFFDRRIGKVLAEDDIRLTLEYLGFTTSRMETGGSEVDKGIEHDERGAVLDDSYYHITSPTWRSTGDVGIRDDILGDIVRLTGYENFDPKPLTVNFNSAIKQPHYDAERKIREYLAFRCNYYEVFTYPWISQKYIDAAGTDTSTAVRLATPPSPDQFNLRQSLIPGLIESAEKNLRYEDSFKIFELAEIFEKGEYCESSPEEKLPVQKMMLTAVGVSDNGEKAFFEAKGVIESLSRFCSIENLNFVKKHHPAWADSDACLNIICGDDIVGNLALISAKTLHTAGIERHQIAAFEIEIDKLKPLASRDNKFEHLPVFPLVEEDLSILVDEDVSWAEIYDAIHYQCKDIRFNEVYRGKQVPEGRKSVMFTVQIGSDNGTLNAKQIDKKMNGIIKSLKKKCGAELRV